MFNLNSAPIFLVVHDDGVVGSYTALGSAKDALEGVDKQNRLIAEVDVRGELNRDPNKVGEGTQLQGKFSEAGFNSYWCDWSCINKLMDICEEYLVPKGNYHETRGCT